VQAWVNERALVLAPWTLRLAVRLVSSVFADAVAEGVLARSPVRVYLPKDDRRQNPGRRVKGDGPVVPLTPEQVQLLGDAMSDRHRAVVIAQGGLGVRAGELLGLRTSEVDFLRREVRIETQLQPVTRAGAAQDAALPPDHSPARCRCRRAGAPHRLYEPADDGSIFTGETTGRPYAREVYSRAFAKAARAVGLPEGTTSHSFRHATPRGCGTRASP
jgi:integrase